MVREQLGEHAAVAHPAGDQLGVLASEVEDDDLFLDGGPLRGVRGAIRPRPDTCVGPPGMDARRNGSRGCGALSIRASLNCAGRDVIPQDVERSETRAIRH